MPDAEIINAIRTSLSCGDRVPDVAKRYGIDARRVREIGRTLKKLGRDFDPGGPDAQGDMTSATSHIQYWDQRPAQRTRKAELARAREAHEDFLARHGIKPPEPIVIVPEEPTKRAKPGPAKGWKADSRRQKRRKLTREIEDARWRVPNDLNQALPYSQRRGPRDD